MPEVDALAERYRGDPTVLVVAVGTGGADRVEHIRTDKHLTLPLPAATESWTRGLGVSAFPETLIVDSQGRIAERIAHGVELADLQARVEWLKAEQRGEVLDYRPAVDRHSALSRAVYVADGLLRRNRSAPSPTAPTDDPFRWRVHTRPDRVELTLHLARGTHTYADQLDVAVVDPGGYVFGRLEVPNGTEDVDPDFGPRDRFDRDVQLVLPVSGEGAGPVTLELRAQVCRGDLCYPPGTTRVQVRP